MSAGAIDWASSVSKQAITNAAHAFCNFWDGQIIPSLYMRATTALAFTERVNFGLVSTAQSSSVKNAFRLSQYC